MLAAIILILAGSPAGPVFAADQSGRGLAGGKFILGKDTPDSPPRLPRYAPGEVLFKVKEAAKPSTGKEKIFQKTLPADVDTQRSTIATRHGLRNARQLLKKPRTEKLKGLSRAEIATGRSVEQTVRELAAQPDVEWAEPNYYRHTEATAVDPAYASQSNYLAAVGLPGAWDTVTGSPQVVVSVIDTGVDWTHPDLAPNIWTNPGEIAGDNIDNDNNGFVDDVHGWDFVGVAASEVYPGEDAGPRDNDPMDFEGHGTHVAGIIGARANNGLNGTGVTWQSSIMPLRAGFKHANGSGLLLEGDIADALIYACDNGARIVNMSFGSSSPMSHAQAAALDYCTAKGVLLVAAAGNDHASSPFYPAAHPDVLAVASVDSAGQLSAFSNHGIWIDVAAPGEGVHSTLVGGGFGPMSGTSMAAPIVSGIGALMMAAHLDWSAAEIRARLRATAESVNSVNPAQVNQLGGGLVRADRAVAGNDLPARLGVVSFTAEEQSSSDDGCLDGGESFIIRPSVRNFGKPLAGVRVSLISDDPYLNITDGQAELGSIHSDERVTSQPDSLAITVAPAVPRNHTALLRFAITSGEGPVAVDEIPLLLNPVMRNETMLAEATDDNGYLAGRLLRHPDGAITALYRVNGLNVANKVLSRERSPQGAWGPEIAVSDGVQGFGNATWYDDALGPDNRVHVVYQANEGPWDNEWLYTVRDPASSIWSMPVRLTSGAGIFKPGLPLDNVPGLAVDPDGRPHLVWADYRSGRPEIYHLFQKGTSWPAASVIARPTANVTALDLFIDESGAMSLLWGQENSQGSTDIYLLRSLKTGWGAPTLVTGAAQDFAGVMDGAGILHLIYGKRNSGDILYTAFDGSSWSSVRQLLGNTNYHGAVGALAADPEGGLHIGHTDQLNWPAGAPQLYEMESAGSSWSAITPLLSAANGTSQVLDGFDLAVGPTQDHYLIGIAAAGDRNNMVFYSSEVDETIFPSRPAVEDAGELTKVADSLSATLTSAHPEGITGYRTAVGTVPGGDDVAGWVQTAGPTVTFDLSSMPLQSGQTYYVSAQALGRNGLRSPIKASDGIMFCPDGAAVGKGCGPAAVLDAGLSYQPLGRCSELDFQVRVTNNEAAAAGPYVCDFDWGDGSAVEHDFSCSTTHSYIAAPGTTVQVTWSVRNSAGVSLAAPNPRVTPVMICP